VTARTEGTLALPATPVVVGGEELREVSAVDQLTAIMAVSRAVAEGQELGDTLSMIAETAAGAARAQAAAIVLRRRESATGLVVAGSYGLSPSYADELNERRPIEVGAGPSGLAAATRRPVLVTDVMTDPLFEPWRKLAVREHFRAVASIPLMLGEGRRVIGVLNVYRKSTRAWAPEQVEVLVALADHAAIAIQTARLLDDTRRQVSGLSLVVRSLRTQSHEHANLVHAVYGLLAIGEVDEARRLIATADDRYRLAHEGVEGLVDNAVISGFLLAETAIAGNADIRLEVDPATSVGALPANVSELDAVTILGNLIQNAVDAVSAMPLERRRIVVLLDDADGGLRIRVRDFGAGIQPGAEDELFTAGYSTKSEHTGFGLSLVRSIVHHAGGTVAVEHEHPGVAFDVRIPAP
jgi:signal transduction histidine kinase